MRDLQKVRHPASERELDCRGNPVQITQNDFFRPAAGAVHAVHPCHSGCRFQRPSSALVSCHSRNRHFHPLVAGAAGLKAAFRQYAREDMASPNDRAVLPQVSEAYPAIGPNIVFRGNRRYWGNNNPRFWSRSIPNPCCQLLCGVVMNGAPGIAGSAVYAVLMKPGSSLPAYFRHGTQKTSRAGASPRQTGLGEALRRRMSVYRESCQRLIS